jgi:ATP-dependent RNA helicase DDX46/PRP5
MFVLQCGLSERMLSVIKKHNFAAPFSIQKQALPAIMCGRDIIAVAKTGSGKTLAFLLPMFRHILDQPPLRDSEGPIGIVMAPARELAYQIYNEAKKFTKALGLSVACVYGGAGVADQIADLKRGADIVVCTPGRMIDILCMQAGKLVSLKRVTMVVMDEADRMFDMGFEPQIKMILQNVRPDRQTVLFSATFPKQIEKLAKSILQFPLEIVVGERSTANKDITQYVEVHEHEDKYMRLLQLLGVWYERGSVLIFVDKQETCDQLFQDLLKSGYPCVSLHGGKDQLDRDHTLHEFKSGIKTVMVATSVAGRGLDVPEIVCVINYHCPNHMEEYVHRVGRTGRAGRKGTAYTFITPSEEQYAPTMITILEKAGVTGGDVPVELVQMATEFKEKVKRGEAHWSSNGFTGSKGYTFDSSEMNEAQKLASMQRRAYEIEQGIISEKVDDNNIDANDDFYEQEGEVEVEGSDMPSTSTGSTVTAPPVPINDTSGTALVLHGSEAVNQESVGAAPAQLAALEKVRALAVSMGLTTAPPPPPQPPSGQAVMTADGKVDTRTALQRAKMIAMQMSGGVAGVEEQEEQQHFADELEINDYPANVRRKVTQRSVLDEVTDRTGTNIISRGSYVPSGKKLEVGERKLFLLIEGPTEMQVKQAKIEVLRLLEEETLRQGASGQVSFSGRYSVT